LRLSGGGCRCAGMLEARWQGHWSRLCRDSLSQASREGICQRLGCGPPMPETPQVILTSGKVPGRWALRCQWPVATLERCHWTLANCTEQAVLACAGESRPLLTPTTATPHPKGPPRLQLVDGELGCSGFLELHKEGLWGAVGDSLGVSAELATRICHSLRCGTAIDGRGYGQPEPRSRLPVRWEVVEPCEDRPLLQCFNKTRAQPGIMPTFIICSGTPPQALRRLGAGPTPCEGDIEVFHEGQWRVLCDNRAQRARRGHQLCQELRCGNLSSSTEVRDPPAMGVTCWLPSLHLCSTSFGGQDSKPQPVGTPAGTIVSICLALLLLGVLLLICGPPAYRRLMKR
ncbi:CD5 protein, partial [Thinocorus orbignyianus]|nr:CD5 protein [Thinocorus orbignyianus]